jgi:GTP-binding protein
LLCHPEQASFAQRRIWASRAKRRNGGAAIARLARFLVKLHHYFPPPALAISARAARNWLSEAAHFSTAGDELMRVLTRFLMSASDPGHFPAPALPEIAFLGRSNVGKSSVINSLVGKKLAKTSSIPGRTRSINFFELRWAGKPQPELIFTDLPGYGYAKLSREVSGRWPDFIEPYLKERPCLALCLVLVDVNVPPQESDSQLLRFLSSIGRPFLIVGTKVDRLSGNQLRNSLRALSQEFPQARVVPFSARSGAGRDDLWHEIREAAQGHRSQLSRAEMPTG